MEYPRKKRIHVKAFSSKTPTEKLDRIHAHAERTVINHFGEINIDNLQKAMDMLYFLSSDCVKREGYKVYTEKGEYQTVCEDQIDWE